ncbi:MAG: energy transducer TonB [Saprospiraceae bacterium]|nr:energy transducer TonB [Saprospiraceae bacterium]
MKKNQLLLIVFLSIGCALNSFAQNDLKFEVNKVLPSIPIQENKLTKINTLTDLDKRYPASWVKEYISVEISAHKNGILTMASGSSDVLTKEQKELIRFADRKYDIAVSVMYLPNNSLKESTAKQHDFKVTIMPEKNATYGKGSEQLTQYLQKNCMANIDAANFKGYDLTAIKFTITEQGQVADIKVALSSKDAKIDEMLVSALSKMPNWKPASFSNGLKVKQSFVLTIGNMESCMVNTLSIRPLQ